jgi:hypothetical protein
MENEYRLALLKVELDFVAELARRLTEEDWGPAQPMANIQASCEREHRRKNDAAREAASVASSPMEIE